MKKELRIKDKFEFNEIIAKKHFFKNQHFVIYIRKKQLENSRFGIAVSKKLGNAVIRNKLKRQMRNLIVDNSLRFSKAYDYIIMIKKQCLIDGYQMMKESLVKLLDEKVK